MGADVNAQNSEGYTALHEAVLSGNLKLVEFLLKNGANVHLKTRCGEPPLLTAVRRNDLIIIDLLTKCGAHLASVDAMAVAELTSFAARSDCVKKLQALFLAGANLDAVDELKHTPLHKAVLCNCPDAVRYLIERCNSHQFKDLIGFTPLDYARQLKRNEIILMLEKRKSTQ